ARRGCDLLGGRSDHLGCDAVAAGLIASLSRPGGNITGVTCLSSELSGKRGELLREGGPNGLKLGVVWKPGDPGKAVEWRNTEAAARALKMKPISQEVYGPGAFNPFLPAPPGPP